MSPAVNPTTISPDYLISDDRIFIDADDSPPTTPPAMAPALDFFSPEEALEALDGVLVLEALDDALVLVEVAVLGEEPVDSALSIQGKIDISIDMVVVI